MNVFINTKPGGKPAMFRLNDDDAKSEVSLGDLVDVKEYGVCVLESMYEGKLNVRTVDKQLFTVERADCVKHVHTDTDEERLVAEERAKAVVEPGNIQDQVDMLLAERKEPDTVNTASPEAVAEKIETAKVVAAQKAAIVKEVIAINEERKAEQVNASDSYFGEKKDEKVI